MIVKKQIEQMRVLVVEDNFIASKTAQMVLESKGCLVDCVFTGKAAIDKLNNRYDLIILDLGLPDMSGFELAKAIRNSKDPLALAKIAIVTAFDIEGNKDLASQLGISHFISKPFTIEKCDLILEANSLMGV